MAARRGRVAAEGLSERGRATRAARPAGRQARAGRESELLELHHLIGNRAVGRLATGTVQCSLRVGAAGDRYEREADAVADALMRSVGRGESLDRAPGAERGPAPTMAPVGPGGPDMLAHELVGTGRDRRTAAPVAARRASVVQRAIVTIDGPRDTPTAKAITTTCLTHLGNVKTKAGVRVGLPGSKPRGESIRDDGAKGFVPKKGFLSENETLYVLAHGEASGRTVAGMTPVQMKDYLNANLGPLFPSGSDDWYLGRIKFVSCISAKEVAGKGANFAAGVANAFKGLAPNHFLPISVDGIVGVGWVDQKTGQILSIDLDEYLRVYASAGGPDKLNAAFAGGDPAEINKLLGGSVTTGKIKGGGKRAGKERHPTY